jgi:hypothetical protein
MGIDNQLYLSKNIRLGPINHKKGSIGESR